MAEITNTDEYYHIKFPNAAETTIILPKESITELHLVERKQKYVNNQNLEIENEIQ